MKTKIMYKLLSKRNNKYYSYNSPGSYGIGNVEYIPNQWVYPKLQGSKLFIFPSVKDAKSCAGYDPLYHIIFKCEVLNPRKVPYEKFCMCSIELWWKTKFKKKNPNKIPYADWDVPKNSWWCDSVKILEEVKND